jgi:hypothetical protein
MVPPAAAPTPVTRVNDLEVSPDPVLANVSLLYESLVSPDAAEVLPYDDDILIGSAVAIGASEVPPIKPFNDLRGPENVVCPIMYILSYEFVV